MVHMMHLRKARISDITDIHRMINHYADKGLLLPRPLGELYEHLRDYSVLVHNAGDDSFVGVCGLGICWDDLAEIKALAVSEDYQGRGAGAMLVKSCIEEARGIGLKRLFTLTYVPDFFLKLGFDKVDKAELPHKVWADCLKCPKFPLCDETALLLSLVND